ncbi:MAG: putative membrane spanning [Trebouxia sp. A1-2]|nr:MAG: putative membrane spanning [Trebouxia sp. A1-2]
MATEGNVDAEISARPQVFSAEQHAGPFAWLQHAAKQLKTSVLALFYASQDPAVGWAPRVIAAFVLAYALSPVDLIPDFIPVLGILDDLILLPGMIWLAVKLIPDSVWQIAQPKG